MNQSAGTPPDAGREEILSALFAQMVLQQTNMALMLLGKIANPQTGEFMRDVEAARFFIDQLEMLEAKTAGNLSKEETNLLKQSLLALRMAFVETIGSPEAKKPAAPSEAPAATEEAAKKFTKKY